MFWDEHEECKQVVSTSWDTNDDSEPWHQWEQKVAVCKRSLQKWHGKTLKNAAKEITFLKQNLASALNSPNNLIDWGEVSSMRKNIDKLWKQEEQYWGQRDL